MTHTLPLIHYIPTKGWNKPFHARSQLRKVLLLFQPKLVLLEYNTWQWTKCGASQSDVRRSSKYDNGLTLVDRHLKRLCLRKSNATSQLWNRHYRVSLLMEKHGYDVWKCLFKTDIYIQTDDEFEIIYMCISCRSHDHAITFSSSGSIFRSFLSPSTWKHCSSISRLSVT